MDYLSYFENQNVNANSSDYITQQMNAALEDALQTQSSIMVQQVAGAEAGATAGKELANAKYMKEAMESGEWGAAASAAGTMILGRKTAIDAATKIKDAFMKKYKGDGEEEEGGEEAGEEVGEEAGEEVATETATTTAPATVSDTTSIVAAMRGQATEAATETAAPATAEETSLIASSGGEDFASVVGANTADLFGEGLTTSDLVAAGLDPAGTSAALSEYASRQAARSAATEPLTAEEGAEEIGAVEDVGESAPSFLTSIPAGGIRGQGLEDTAQGVEEGEENLEGVGEAVQTDMVATRGALLTNPTGVPSTAGQAAVSGQAGTGAEASVGTGTSAFPSSADGAGGLSEGTELGSNITTQSTAAAGRAGTSGVTAAGEGTTATIDTVGEAPDAALAAGGTIAAEEGGVAAASAGLEAAGAALQAVPFADVLGGLLLVGGIAAPLIMSSIDKKKERREKRKAKKKAREATAEAQATYNKALQQHNDALSSLNSNNHVAITGGIEQKTGATSASASF